MKRNSGNRPPHPHVREHTFSCLQLVVGHVHGHHALQYLWNNSSGIHEGSTMHTPQAHASQLVGVAASAPPTFLLASISFILLCEALSVRRLGSVM